MPCLMSPTNLASRPAAHMDGVHLGGRLELKERELGGREKNGAKPRFLIKAQMLIENCAYKAGGPSPANPFLEPGTSSRIGCSLQNSSVASQQVAVS